MKAQIITMLVIGGAVYMLQKRGGVFGLDPQDSIDSYFAAGSGEWDSALSGADKDEIASYFVSAGDSIFSGENVQQSSFLESLNSAITGIGLEIKPVFETFNSALDSVFDGGGDKSQPRGIRNNNAGNLEYTGEPWKGLDNPPSDGRFMRFTTPIYGLRALARLLMNYQIRYGLNTVSKIIDRWAPPHENNTTAYKNAVAGAVGVGVNQEINVRTKLPQLVAAIVKHENGIQPYSAGQINEAISIMGV